MHLICLLLWLLLPRPFSKLLQNGLDACKINLVTQSVDCVFIGDINNSSFERKDIKTVVFNVRTKNEYVTDKNGDSVLMFLGYVVEHSLKISFDLDMKKLPETLSVISTSKAKPRVDIAFTLKDDSEIKEEALRNASINARKKAEILAITSGVKLGKLISIDYSWKDIELYSDTKCYDSMPYISKMASIDIEPDDIKAEDSVTFTWEIEVDDLSYDL